MTPEQQETLLEAWTQFLELSFSGLDFWRLSKKWKQKVYRDTAKIMLADILYLEKVNKDGIQNQTDQRTDSTSADHTESNT